jgi:hypothetical protein
MKNWAIFVDGIFHSRYKRRSDADGHAAFLRETTGKRVEVVWDIEPSSADRIDGSAGTGDPVISTVRYFSDLGRMGKAIPAYQKIDPVTRADR